EQHAHLVVKIVGPDSVEPLTTPLHRSDAADLVTTILGDDHNLAITGSTLPRLGQLPHDVDLAVVDHGVGRIETEPIDVILTDPVAGIVDRELSYPVAVLTVPVQPGTPGGRVPIAEVVPGVGSEV